MCDATHERPNGEYSIVLAAYQNNHDKSEALWIVRKYLPHKGTGIASLLFSKLEGVAWIWEFHDRNSLFSEKSESFR